jgi:hypothetical protein
MQPKAISCGMLLSESIASQGIGDFVVLLFVLHFLKESLAGQHGHIEYHNLDYKL